MEINDNLTSNNPDIHPVCNGSHQAETGNGRPTYLVTVDLCLYRDLSPVTLFPTYVIRIWGLGQESFYKSTI